MVSRAIPFDNALSRAALYPRIENGNLTDAAAYKKERAAVQLFTESDNIERGRTKRREALPLFVHHRPRKRGNAPGVATPICLASEAALQGSERVEFVPRLKRVSHPEIHLHEIVSGLVDDTIIGFAKYADVRCEPVF
jgi:hypothetical protein